MWANKPINMRGRNYVQNSSFDVPDVICMSFTRKFHIRFLLKLKFRNLIESRLQDFLRVASVLFCFISI